ncbi:class I SAM-dependent RNA methyltransferase [Parerythrobacter lacustris]|uniref:Class I SAM-dependent RNA methyltransferase n=1 Tax=Parerythrobacter lacustris TaxID=2969984 RepID=A0ABT1XPU0_9SPHN|nr:class I SAM-dependent RNA methyltransferase [Parerythrobacter lacustris]MCR2833679.1 class I SAM-dependent RNA methyltransferase [Parerythrobacter lacustris]
MSEFSEIVRVAAKGDGVTSDGRHVPLAAPGDRVAADGTVLAGPHHADPPCRHFPQCGGCQLQHLDEDSWHAFVTARVVNAATGHELVPEEVLTTWCSPPASRRRATLHAIRGKGAAVGFREQGSHRIVDQRECPVLRPELQALVGPLRELLEALGGKGGCDVHLALAEQGVVCELRKLEVDGLRTIERLTEFAQNHGLARLTVDQGYGAETQWEPEPATVRLGGVSLGLPHDAFLQPTEDGEAALLADAREWLAGATTVADLFAGLGTFAFGLAGQSKVLAVEAARDSHLACRAAAAVQGLPVHALHRDLFRTPLTTSELNRFGAVLLDPPRAGAREQCAQLAASTVERVVYISCNPSSWARDARQLVEGGYRLAKLRPIGQFRWSTHVELASLFVR